MYNVRPCLVSNVIVLLIVNSILSTYHLLVLTLFVGLLQLLDPRRPTLLFPGFCLESAQLSVAVGAFRFLSRRSSTKAGAASGDEAGEKSPRSSSANILLLVRLKLEALKG